MEANAFIHAYVDGELAGVDRDSYEKHLLVCEACSHACRLQARFKAAVRGHLPRPPLPSRLPLRIERALAGAPPIRRVWFWHSYPRLAPAAAAAVVLVAIMGVARYGGQRPLVLEQALRAYHSAMPMDVVDSSCAKIANWFRGRVDFNVPTSLEKLGGCQGGRLVNVNDRFGLYVVYQLPNGHRVTMTIFNAEDERMGGPNRRVVGGQDVYFHTARGASAALYRDRDGLGYAVTADLDEDALSNVMQAAFRQ